jgi:TolB protein
LFLHKHSDCGQILPKSKAWDRYAGGKRIKMRKNSLFLKSAGIFLAIALIGLAMTSSALAGDPTGGSPIDPLMAPSNWINIAPTSTTWYYFDYGSQVSSSGGPGPARPTPNGHPTVNVTVDLNGVSGVQFAVYTPEQGKDYLRDAGIAPVGRGAAFRDTASGEIAKDLYWSGAFNSSGRYFIAVSNSTSKPIAFRLTVTGDTVALYPPATPTATPTIPALVAATPAPHAIVQGKIVFETATGGSIYTVNGDGTNLKLLTQGIDPAWSPVGAQIAYARWGATFPGLYVINADGSDEHLVYGSNRIRSPRWSSDGKFIAFTQEKVLSNDNTQWKLGVIELNKPIDGETTKNVLTEPQCTTGCLVPSWSNTGTTLVYTDPQYGILTTSVISGSASLTLGPTGLYYDTVKNLALPIEHLTQIQSSITSPNGNQIVYSQATHDRWELNIANWDGTNRSALTSPNGVLYTLWGVIVNNVAPSWSPDSKQILFLSDRNGKWEFFVMNADGSNIRQVLKNVTDQVMLGFSYQNERMADWTR